MKAFNIAMCLLIYTVSALAQVNTHSPSHADCNVDGKLTILNIPTEFESFADYVNENTSVEKTKKYFKTIVQNKSSEDFAKSYLDMAKSKIGKNAEFKKVQLKNYYFEVVFDKADRSDKKKDDSDLTSRSYTKKVWVKKDNKGHVLEVGSSEIKTGSQEQEVFYFAGPLQNQGFSENW